MEFDLIYFFVPCSLLGFHSHVSILICDCLCGSFEKFGAVLMEVVVRDGGAEGRGGWNLD